MFLKVVRGLLDNSFFIYFLWKEGLQLNMDVELPKTAWLFLLIIALTQMHSSLLPYGKYSTEVLWTIVLSLFLKTLLICIIVAQIQKERQKGPSENCFVDFFFSVWRSISGCLVLSKLSTEILGLGQKILESWSYLKRVVNTNSTFLHDSNCNPST